MSNKNKVSFLKVQYNYNKRNEIAVRHSAKLPNKTAQFLLANSK